MTFPSLPNWCVRNAKPLCYAGRSFLDIGASNFGNHFPSKMIGSPILRLLGGRCPSAIVGRIRLHIVDSVKRHTLRGFTHVAQKIHEAIPSGINGYTASSVFMISGVSWRVAPSFHALPSSISSRPRASAIVGVTVKDVCHMTHHNVSAPYVNFWLDRIVS